MGLIDHQWALARGGRASVASVLDLVDALRDEKDPNVLAALQKPLLFLANALIPDAAPGLEAPFRSWLSACYGPAFRLLGWEPAPGEPDPLRRLRGGALVLAGSIARDAEIVEEACARCDTYLGDRRSLDANLADAVVGVAAAAGGAVRYEQFLKAAAAGSPQERRRFLLTLADFPEPRLVRATLSLVLTNEVPNQEVLALLVRLLENPAARVATWAFVSKRWSSLRKRLPDFQARLLIEETPLLLTPEHRRQVARFFRSHPVASGERALRQALERFDWYRGFRRDAARELAAWLAARAPTG
jgi:aminopeptidase N